MGRLGNQRTAGGGVLLQKGLINRHTHQQSAEQSPGVHRASGDFYRTSQNPAAPGSLPCIIRMTSNEQQ
jgi:hypothetical protein